MELKPYSFKITARPRKAPREWTPLGPINAVELPGCSYTSGIDKGGRFNKIAHCDRMDSDCPMQLIFKEGRIGLRLCVKRHKRGPFVPVTDWVDAVGRARTICAEWHSSKYSTYKGWEVAGPPGEYEFEELYARLDRPPARKIVDFPEHLHRHRQPVEVEEAPGIRARMETLTPNLQMAAALIALEMAMERLTQESPWDVGVAEREVLAFARQVLDWGWAYFEETPQERPTEPQCDRGRSLSVGPLEFYNLLQAASQLCYRLNETSLVPFSMIASTALNAYVNNFDQDVIDVWWSRVKSRLAFTYPEKVKIKTAPALVTPVIFRAFRDNGEVIALFPTLPGGRRPWEILSYMHVGQHGTADYFALTAPAPGGGWSSAPTRPATALDYEDLYRELTALGYNLSVRQKFSPKLREELEQNRREMRL